MWKSNTTQLFPGLGLPICLVGTTFAPSFQSPEHFEHQFSVLAVSFCLTARPQMVQFSRSLPFWKWEIKMNNWVLKAKL